MKRRKRLLKIANTRRKNKEKYKNENKDLKLSVYSYKCGNKDIRLTVQKKEVPKNSKTLNSVYYYNCTFCSKDFDTCGDIQIPPFCPDCNQPLVKINLRKCPQCGAKNNPLKETCWICNAPFAKAELGIEKETQLLLTLNIDGVFYRNTDKPQGLGLKKLFEDLITTGFSKDPLESWIRAQENNLEDRKESLREECRFLAQESKRKSLTYIAAGMLIITILLLLARMFWSD